MHLAHWIYPGGIEGRRQLDGIKRHVVSDRSQSYLPDVPHNDSRCDGNVGDRLGRQQLPRRRQRGDACGDVDCRTKEVVRSAEYSAVAKTGPCQWNPWLGSASWKQTSEHLKGGCRIRKSKHRFVTDPLDRRRDASKGLAHQFLEAPKHRYCRRISIDIGYRAEARQIDERDGCDRGLEAVDRADVRTHSRLWWGRWCGSSVDLMRQWAGIRSERLRRLGLPRIQQWLQTISMTG